MPDFIISSHYDKIREDVRKMQRENFDLAYKAQQETVKAMAKMYGNQTDTFVPATSRSAISQNDLEQNRRDLQNSLKILEGIK